MAKNHMDENLKIQSADSAVSSKNVSPTTVTYIADFLTCIQISQEAGQVVYYSHLLKSFPQFVVMHTVKGFSTVNEAEVDVFMKFPCFSCDPNGCW